MNHYLYEQAQTEEEKIFYLSKEIENYFTSVMKQTMYTELEKRLYERRNKEELSSSILSEEYARILKEYYGESIVYDEIAKIEWSRLGHLYRHSYYPYKYATGLLIASTVVQSLVEEKSLSEDEYIAFLSAGSNQYSVELLKQIKVDLMEEKGMEFKTKIFNPLFFSCGENKVAPFYVYFNITTPEMLRKVLAEQKKYAPSGVYIMRIHGTFVNFLDLSPEIQQDIIKRLDLNSTAC